MYSILETLMHPFKKKKKKKKHLCKYAFYTGDLRESGIIQQSYPDLFAKLVDHFHI
jgi:hypothetical protein